MFPKKSELTKARDRRREQNAVVAKVAGGLRVELAAQRQVAGVFKPDHLRVLEAKARTTALDAWKAANAEAAPLRTLLSGLRELERAAEQRQISREEVVTERMLRAARYAPPYTPKIYVYDATDPRPMIGDRLVNELVNDREQERASRADLTDAVHALRIAVTLPKLSAAELARRATDAAECGDAATLNAVWQEHESRSYADDHIRASVSVAVRQAIQRIELPPEVTEQLALLDEIADADAELSRMRVEIETGELPAASKARLVGELGERGYQDHQHQAAAELRAAAEKRAEQMVRNSAAELVTNNPPAQ